MGRKKEPTPTDLEESTGVILSKRRRVCELDQDEELEVTAPECQSMPGQREIAVDVTSNSGTHAKLDKIIQMVSQMSLQRSDSRSHTSSMPSIAQDVATEIFATKTLIQCSNSLDRLCAINKLVADEEKGILECDISSTDIGCRSKARAGIFHYDFSLGCDFSESNQPMAFVNLKKSVARHIASTAHQNSATNLQEESENQRKLQAKEQSIGLVLGKQAYRLLKFGRPFKD